MRKKGQENIELKGDLITKVGVPLNKYANAHKWVSRNYGPANKCENPECVQKSKKYHYALKKGCQYEKNRESFIMLCASCHQRYDWKPEYGLRLKGNIWTPEQRQKLSKSMMGKKKSKETIEYMSHRMTGYKNPMYGVKLMGEENSFFGKKHTDDSRKKMSESSGELTKEQVLQIRAMYKDGIKQSVIADTFKMNRPRVNKIIKNKIYIFW